MAEINSLFAKSPPKTFKKGTILIKPDENIKKLFLLTDGNVKQYSLTPSGQEVTIHIFKPGSFFPVMLVLAKSPNRFYFETLTKVTVKASDTNKIINSLKKDPAILFDLTTRLSKGLDGMVKRLEYTLNENVHDRLASLLNYFIINFGTRRKLGVYIQIPLTHYQLATWLGVSRETVSREMKRLEKEGVITRKKRKIIIYKSPKRNFTLINSKLPD